MTTKQGRKSKYDDRFAEIVAGFSGQPQSLMQRGKLSDVKLAELFGVVRGTVIRWRVRTAGHETEYHPAFAAACTACQNAIDAGEIKRSIVERARGFVQKKKIRQVGQDGKLVVVREETVRIAGDVAAAKLVLPNIQKQLPDDEKWDTSDKVNNTHELGKSLADFLKDMA